MKLSELQKIIEHFGNITFQELEEMISSTDLEKVLAGDME